MITPRTRGQWAYYTVSVQLHRQLVTTSFGINHVDLCFSWRRAISFKARAGHCIAHSMDIHQFDVPEGYKIILDQQWASPAAIPPTIFQDIVATDTTLVEHSSLESQARSWCAIGFWQHLLVWEGFPYMRPEKLAGFLQWAILTHEKHHGLPEGLSMTVRPTTQADLNYPTSLGAPK